jgi:lipopolysaccharide transport system ATP-binding protein
MSCRAAIKLAGVAKRFEMYKRPSDRLRQFLIGNRRRYYQELWALRNLDLVVARGETVGVLGRNGSGKSTLLQIVAGTLSPTSGVVEVNGRLSALLELGSGFNPEFTGRENVFLNGAVLGLAQHEIAARYDAIRAFADIGDYLDQPVKTYSTGMYVRLAFAVQACIEPDVLIVDEALSVGDEKFQRKCFEHIEGLRERGCAILLVTHSTETVEKFCQRGVLLDHGEVHGIGPAKEIVDQYHALLYSDEQTYLRYLNRNSATPVAAMPDGDANALPSAAIRAAAGAGAGVVIHSWQIWNEAGQRSEAFRTGETARVRFFVDLFASVNELQLGLLIRTIEGVSAFGTSTSYHRKNTHHVTSGVRLCAEFDIRLDLCVGNYFITLAAADAAADERAGSGMSYLDRRTDVMMIAVKDQQPLSHGIAALSASITIQPALMSEQVEQCR